MHTTFSIMAGGEVHSMKSTNAMPRARRDSLVIQKLDDETLVYDLERDEAHCLNKTAALVWERCDGKTTDQGMAKLLQKEFHTPVDVDLVWLAVKQLQRFHLIDDAKISAHPARSVSRRRLLLKYAPAALALPVIISITAPAVQAAASCALNGQSCQVLPCCAGAGTCTGNPLICR